jgi:hypothetical protein
MVRVDQLLPLFNIIIPHIFENMYDSCMLVSAAKIIDF